MKLFQLYSLGFLFLEGAIVAYFYQPNMSSKATAENEKDIFYVVMIANVGSLAKHYELQRNPRLIT